MENVVDARGPPEHRFYLVRWLDWERNGWSDSWRPWRDMLNATEAVDKFWASSSLNREATIEVDGEV